MNKSIQLGDQGMIVGVIDLGQKHIGIVKNDALRRHTDKKREDSMMRCHMGSLWRSVNEGLRFRADGCSGLLGLRQSPFKVLSVS